MYSHPGFQWDGFDAYLFDIDGTLLRSGDGVHYQAFFSSVRSVLNHDLVLEGVTVHGNTDPGILRDAFRVAQLSEDHWRPALDRILDEMRNSVEAQRSEMKVRVMPGVEQTLAHLSHKGAALGVATGNLATIGWTKVELAGLRNWFTFGGFSDLYDVRAEMISNAAAEARKAAGSDASICVVGDTPFDISAARANSLPTIAVATGHYTFDDLMQYQPEACATTLSALFEPISR
ncbi:MAG: HAD family hydrolase [Acidobacteria bacterium]|nr:HAD family hydrolase [Acidobacteriota bacterium]MBW4044742.1 HAD family hydrolase [Acidobacteriota bacterium]